MLKTIQGFGWIPDHPDHRDYRYAAPTPVLRALPSRVDLRPAFPPVYRQGDLGSCTAQAVAAAFQFNQQKQDQKAVFAPSRLFIYYNARALDGTVDSDSGAMLRDAIKGVAHHGVCPEIMWPYRPEAFRTRPTDACYRVAAWNQAIIYQRLTQNLSQLKGCLASGYPFSFGMTAYESFKSPEVASTGVVSLPRPKEAVVGAHAVLAVGYDDARDCFIARNSYGAEWGMRGYFALPYAYLTQEDLARDFWVIRMVE